MPLAAQGKQRTLEYRRAPKDADPEKPWADKPSHDPYHSIMDLVFAHFLYIASIWLHVEQDKVAFT